MCQCLVRVCVQFARSTCLGDVLTIVVRLTRDAAKVRCSTYLRLAGVGFSRNVMLAERNVERPSFFSFSFFFC